MSVSERTMSNNAYLNEMSKKYASMIESHVFILRSHAGSIKITHDDERRGQINETLGDQTSALVCFKGFNTSGLMFRQLAYDITKCSLEETRENKTFCIKESDFNDIEAIDITDSNDIRNLTYNNEKQLTKLNEELKQKEDLYARAVSVAVCILGASIAVIISSKLPQMIWNPIYWLICIAVISIAAFITWRCSNNHTPDFVTKKEIKEMRKMLQQSSHTYKMLTDKECVPPLYKRQNVSDISMFFCEDDYGVTERKYIKKI